ncbi:MAG: ABC transporter substrate-binding protein [Anaerolineales bacterium]|nr:ABC transporter substrate-binding protein [Anaerolineales bacterium]
MQTIRRSYLSIVLVVVVALLLAACAGAAAPAAPAAPSDSAAAPEAATTEAASAEAAAPTGDAIPIGVAVAQTSNVALFGQEQVLGAQLAEQYFNEQGGVNGTPIQLVLQDTAGEEAGAINAFQTLINGNVVAIIGPTLSQQAFAADPFAEKAGVPVIAPSNTAKGIPQIGPYTSRVSAPVAKVAPNALAAALKINPEIKKVAVAFAQNDAFSNSETGTFQNAITDTFGLELVTVQTFQTTDTDFTTQASNILNAAPDLVVISGLAADGANLIKQLRDLGYTGLIVGGNGLNTANIFPVCQAQCDGILVAQAYSPMLDSAVNKMLVDTYSGAQGKTPGQFTAQAFAAVQVIVEALKAVDAKTPLKEMALVDLRNALNAELLSGAKYDTPLGLISFDPEGEINQEQFYVAQIKMDADGANGKFELLK